MPMDFPDMDSLKRCATVHKFRQPTPEETEGHFRAALANWVESRDLVESMEIRAGCGWDTFSAAQNSNLVRRALLRSLNR